ncbi:Telomere length regulation protein [Parelaphostrongylus tenuis]|uniref:Telomere length regulation protein n=1 Tax=Parelaphostrongylus tenuis TaxID=148309 RepID=A0AAD5WLG7_PARTN|nr:Telomere length regulation protein [Parelaphostrongylus tenuis]
MSSVSKRLSEAEERSVIVNILTEVLAEVDWEKDCSILLEAIIDNIHKIIKFLTQGEVSTYIDNCFTIANPLYAIPVLVSRLSVHDSVDRIAYWINLSLRYGLERTLKDSVSMKSDDFLYQKYEDFISCLVFLREKLLNVINKNSSTLKVPDYLQLIETRLCSALTSSLEHVFNLIVAGNDVNLHVLHLLISKSRSVLLNDSTLLHYVIRWLCSREESAIWDRIAQRVLTDDSISTRDCEMVVTEVVLSASKTSDLMRCFGFSIRHNTIVSRVCCKKFLLQRLCDPSLVLVLADYLHIAATKETYLSTFEMVVSVWADPTHVRYVAVEQQMHVTRVLLSLGRWVNEVNGSDAWKSLFNSIFPGVEARIAYPDKVICQSGMFVGETFAVLMGGEQLKFEYEEDSWLAEMRRIRDGVCLTPENAHTCVDMPTVVKQCDPAVPSSSTHISESQAVDSDDGEDFPAYYVPDSERNFETLSDDSEPVKKVPAPNYIRDCLKQLDEKEKYEVFEAAFFALNAMIRRKAVGFIDIADILVKKLVFLEDKFATKDFEVVRMQCLVSCLVMRPEVAPKLGDMVFSRNCTFFHRHLILKAFVTAAKELAQISKEQSTKNVTDITEGQKEKLSDWREIVEARIRSNTRRITTVRKPEVLTPNRFAPVATLFFYPLLRTETGEHLELKGRDSSFLARLLNSVSEILQAATNTPSVVKMAASLAETVTPLRFHPEVFIRSAVLFAYFSIAVAVPDEVFYELFGKIASEWVEWALFCADNVDAPEQLRGFARSVAVVLSQKIKSVDTRID